MQDLSKVTKPRLRELWKTVRFIRANELRYSLSYLLEDVAWIKRCLEERKERGHDEFEGELAWLLERLQKSEEEARDSEQRTRAKLELREKLFKEFKKRDRTRKGKRLHIYEDGFNNRGIDEVGESPLALPSYSDSLQGMKKRIRFDRNPGSPPTKDSHYGNHRWSGVGKKTDKKNWKRKRKTQYK